MTSSYQKLATLRTKLNTTRKTERRQTSKELLELLSDPTTIRNLHIEAERHADDKIYPSERVSVLLRNVLEASLVASQSVVTEGKKKNTNGTGYVKQSKKFTIEDVLFPYRVFLRIDGPLECYNVERQDWKHMPRYCFHLDPTVNEVFSTTTFTDQIDCGTQRTHLSSKEVIGSISYIIMCLNNPDCCDLAEIELMQWLAHICARPDYVTFLPLHSEISYILHEVSARIYAEFDEKRGRSSFAAMHDCGNVKQVRQECLVACAKCLAGLVYNTTTRLGIGMQLYLRPIVELISSYAEHAWLIQSGGGLSVGITNDSLKQSQQRTDMDIVSLLPHLYLAVTHLVAAHPEQSVAVFSETGLALLRLAKKNYLRSASDPKLRDALTEYFGAHLLVAETSGKLYGLPEGDVGPLVMDISDEQNENNVALGATLDIKAIDSLLKVVRDEKVWESLFNSSSKEDVSKMIQLHQRNRFRSQKRKRGFSRTSDADGGRKWTPLSKNQRRYLELMARLLRLSQRYHLADIEGVIFNHGSSDPLENFIIETKNISCYRSGIENGEIDIDANIQTTSDLSYDKRSVLDNALSELPFVKVVCEHLYSLNPKLHHDTGVQVPRKASTIQSTLQTSADEYFTVQRLSVGGESPGDRDKETASLDQHLFDACTLLRAVVTNHSGAAKRKTETNWPSTIATLQVICACAEAFPRGECWASSARQNWSIILDENVYPGGTSASVRERHGSSLTDVASVIYLLGNTLESSGGIGGDDNIQTWTLVSLLKMAESTAIICTREGVTMQSLEALNMAWQSVWNTLLRYDLRYSSYMIGAYANNAGELGLQLLTQMIRYQCTDRQIGGKLLFSNSSPFIQTHISDILQLPVFENPTSIISGTCFELVTALSQFTELPINLSKANTLPDVLSSQNERDRNWLISFCLMFIENSLTDESSRSMIQRSVLPFVATCIASLISNGVIVEKTTTFELDSLMTFSIVEDSDCVYTASRTVLDTLDCKSSISDVHHILWRKILAPFIHLSDYGLSLEKRIMEGRGAALNIYSSSTLERKKLSTLLILDTGSSSMLHKHRDLGDLVFEKIKLIFDEILYRIRYGDEDEDESEGGRAASKMKTANSLRITTCVSLLLSTALSSRMIMKDACDYIISIAPNTICLALDRLPQVLDAFVLAPSDLLHIINHVDGVIKVLIHVAASDDDTSKLPLLLKNQFKVIFSACESVLRNHRHSQYVSSNLSLTQTIKADKLHISLYDSNEDEHRGNQIPTQRLKQNTQFSEDSDGFMDDIEDTGHSKHRVNAPLKRSIPPLKRRRAENAPGKLKHQKTVDTRFIDYQYTWGCASLMMLLNPSIKCLEIIARHLVWPEHCDSQNGYSPVSKSLDPKEALVCASLFCQKDVIVREHMLRSKRTMNDQDTQQSAIAICTEVIIQARRHVSSSSKYFMFGLGLLLDLVEMGDEIQNCRTISAIEAKFIIDALYPEGEIKDSEDYRQKRQFKKMLKHRNIYRAEQVDVSIGIFLRGQEDIHHALDTIFSEYFIKSSFHHIDEAIRSRACNALGAALGGFPDQQMIVSEMNRSILPPLKSDKKFSKWINLLADHKLPVDLTQLEQSALNDARLSFEFHAIESIGIIAGSTTDESVCVDMIWKLLDLSAFEPAMGLLCRRACERAAMMLGFKNVIDLFSDMAPRLLVKWIESHKSLNDFPALITSPSTLQNVCRYYPNEVLNTLVSEGGLDDKIMNRNVPDFVQSWGDFLIPTILLIKSDNISDKHHVIDSYQYLSQYASITTGSTSDETVAKILRYHIGDTLGIILVLRELDNPELQSICDQAYKHLEERTSKHHIELHGAKQASMILRRMLKLHAIGVAIVGQEVQLSQSCFIGGMKSLAKNINQSTERDFLNSAKCSMTELLIVSGYWLSFNSISVRQQEKYRKPFELLSSIMRDELRQSTITPQEFSFCINFFVSIALDPQNTELVPYILQYISDILKVLFYQTNDIYVSKVIPTIHKLCLALLTVHNKSFINFVRKCNLSMSRISYNKKCLGLLTKLNKFDDSLDKDNDGIYYPDNILNNIIKLNASIDEKTSSDIMIGAYDCLDTIVSSGKISLNDIIGADDITNQHEAARRKPFGETNEKYEVDHLFHRIRHQERTLLGECSHFIQIMEQYPIINEDFQVGASQSKYIHNIDALARLLALKRLEKSINTHDVSNDNIVIPYDVIESLIAICQSNDSNEAKVMSSRCLGELIASRVSPPTNFDNMPHLIGDPLQKMKIKALSMIGHFITCGSDIAFIAMKTAKSVLSLKDGVQHWELMEDEIAKGVLKPFLVSHSKQSNGVTSQKEQIISSSKYINKLGILLDDPSLMSGSGWCWNVKLWTCVANTDSNSDTNDAWIREMVVAIISCYFGKEPNRLCCSFITICQGLASRDPYFASCMFPGIIYYILNTESEDYKYNKQLVREVILSETGIGSPTGQMNERITRCFACIISAFNRSANTSSATRVVLDTLVSFHFVTQQRFISSLSHKKNASELPKGHSTISKVSRKISDAKICDMPTPPKWRGVPYGIVLRLEGLDVAKAFLNSKRYYSAIYFCELAMQNYCGVGNFLEQIATNLLQSENVPSIGDISGFGIEQAGEMRPLLDLALEAKDILVCCLSNLQLQDELQGVSIHGDALSLKHSMATLDSIEESHVNQKFDMLLGLDVALQSSSSVTNVSLDASRVATYLEDLGLNHVQEYYLKGVCCETNIEFHEKWFEDALYQTSQWDQSLLTLPDTDAFPVSHRSVTSTSYNKFSNDSIASSLVLTRGFNQAVYQALQSFVGEDISGGYSAIASARESVISDMNLFKGTESKLTSITTHLAKLNICGSLIDIGKAMEGKTSLQDTLKHWGFVDDSGIKDLKSLLLSIDETCLDVGEQPFTFDGDLFRLLRLNYSIKEVLLSILFKMFPQNRDNISQAMTHHIYASCRIYRDIGRPDVAKRGLSRLRTLLNAFEETASILPTALRLEDAKIFAHQLNFGTAINQCKMIVAHLSNSETDDADHSGLLSQALLVGGCFMAHEHVDAVELVEAFFVRAAKISHHVHKTDTNSSGLVSAVTYFKLGEFASSIYASIDARSEAWKQRKLNLIEREKEVAALEAERSRLEKKYKKSKKQSDIDMFNVVYQKLSQCLKEADLERREVESNLERRKKYLGMALDSYCNGLKLCPVTATSIDYSKHVFKLLGLWFKNCQHPETQSVVNNLIESSTHQIPTYHFVPLIYQIFSRIESVDNFFQHTLRDLVISICSEHPYHTIPQLIALSNGNLVNKVDAAKSIIDHLQKHAPKYVAGLIGTYTCLMNAYMDLAALDTNDIPRKQTTGFTFRKYKLKLDVCLSGGRNENKNTSLQNAPALISKPPSIRPDTQYGDGNDDPIGTERVIGFESTFELAQSGIHRPAIVICVGSKGGKFRQLVKGEDDTRQDAVMQQVFGTMNNLLHESNRGNDSIGASRNSRQKLKVITYGIAPLSPKAGVLEWVDDTDTFGNFMLGGPRNVGALSKYYPGEWGNSACHKLYANGHEHKNQEQRRRDFDLICRNISPVFRFFFIENFSSSMEAWHTARTAYTRSCAVNSIVGHILGIGDRHTSNILVHTKTGELVHIDFGYVFEQGKLLRTPETVPFRLTRNIIDGMGPCGTDGVFSKSAEATLSALRKNPETVLTILSAIVSDTLVRWSQASSTAENIGNNAAERAMSKVHDKLQGYEDGTTGMHTVAGQVKFLVNEARDPNNLCNLYVGWQSWI